jgi:pimeloyl-ACP methyl ester carboxylesterase/ubiquinone/menaquinone biosynthesis C-methylase UbiE
MIAIHLGLLRRQLALSQITRGANASTLVVSKRTRSLCARRSFVSSSSNWSSSSSSRTVSARGVDFHVEFSAANLQPNPHPVLCLVGALGTAQSDFSAQLQGGLGEEFQIVALDPRGLGKSRIVGGRQFPPDFYLQDALDAHAVMKELGHDTFTVLGWSDGANAALQLASRFPEAVDNLVVWGGNAYITKQDVEAWESVRDVTTWSERMRTERAAMHGGLTELQRLNHQATDAYNLIYQNQGGDVGLEALHHIQCPTLVVHGAKDVICDFRHAKYMARQIPDAYLTVLAQGKHNLHLRHADDFHRVVRDFLLDNSSWPSEKVIPSSNTTTTTTDDDDNDEPEIDRIAYAFMGSKALFVALRAGVFDAIDEISKSSGTAGVSFEKIQAQSEIQGERLRTLLSACVSLKLIKRRVYKGQEVYTLPKASTVELCQSSKRGYWGDYMLGQVDAQFYSRLQDLDETMRTGTSSSHGYEAWFEQDPEAARRYTEAQHNGSLATGYALWKRLPQLVANHSNGMRLLDVGGGSGAFSIATARKIPQATAVVLDLPNVVAVAQEIIDNEEHSVRERLSTLALSATAPGEWQGVVADASFDVVLMSYVSGSIPVEALEGLYRNAFRALRPGGCAIIHDFFVDNSGRGPQNAALWALAHVSVNPEGMGLRPSRIVDLLCQEGFLAPKVDDLIPGTTQVIVATKPEAP